MVIMRLLAVHFAITISMAAFGGGIPDDQSPRAVEEWYQNLHHAEPKLTKLHFYLHNIFTGQNTTFVQVARANVTLPYPTRFGTVTVMDAPLTAGTDIQSERLGSAQGLYAFSSQQEMGFFVTLNFGFTAGKFNGSSLGLFGGSPVDKQYREFEIVGGSGVLRLARGTGTVQTYTFDDVGEILEFDFVIVHY